MSDRIAASILRLEQVSLRAAMGSDFLLDDISFDVELGTKVAVVGASGAGKTSLLRLLNRLVVPSQGKIYFKDLPAEQTPAVSLRRQIVLIPQEPKLLGMKVIDALSYPLHLQQLPESEINQRINTWIDLLRIRQEWLHKTELQLSLGQRQIVAIARALVMQPKILLLDEPTSALDLGTANHLLTILNDLNQSQELTMIIVNHQLDLIKSFCDRILYLDTGKLEADLPSTEANWQTIQHKIVSLKAQQEREWD